MLVIHKDDSGLLSVNIDAHFFAHVILWTQIFIILNWNHDKNLISFLTDSEVSVDMVWGHELGAQRGLSNLAWAEENDSEMVIKLNNRLLLCLQRFL